MGGLRKVQRKACNSCSSHTQLVAELCSSILDRAWRVLLVYYRSEEVSRYPPKIGDSSERWVLQSVKAGWECFQVFFKEDVVVKENIYKNNVAVLQYSRQSTVTLWGTSLNVSIGRRCISHLCLHEHFPSKVMHEASPRARDFASPD